MRTLTFGALISGLMLTACTVATAPRGEPAVVPAAKPDASNLPAACELGERIEIDGAVVYAVVNRTAPESTEYITLHEAMEAKKATVREVEGGGSVNTLVVSNEASQPLFLMAGDLVLGGQQDRIVAESVVLDAGAKDVSVPVFCVEHGRWSLQSKDAGKCDDGYFYTSASAPQCDMTVKRAAIETKNQSAVWDNVRENNERLSVAGEASSGTFRATFDNKDTSEKIEKNVVAAKKLAGKHVVGFAVYSGNQMVAMDVFESSGLANKLSDKLLRSYVITGLNGGYKDEAVVTPEVAEQAGNDAPELNSRSEGGIVDRSGEQDRGANEDRVAVQSNTSARAIRGRSSAMAPRTGTEETTVNARTANVRDYKKDAVDYRCNDTKSGRAVQTSFMRR